MDYPKQVIIFASAHVAIFDFIGDKNKSMHWREILRLYLDHIREHMCCSEHWVEGKTLMCADVQESIEAVKKVLNVAVQSERAKGQGIALQSLMPYLQKFMDSCEINTPFCAKFVITFMPWANFTMGL